MELCGGANQVIMVPLHPQDLWDILSKCLKRIGESLRHINEHTRAKRLGLDQLSDLKWISSRRIGVRPAF